MNTLNWNEIYTKTSPKLLGICRRYIKDIATAEDIIQDSFIVAIQKENTLKDTNALHGWLSRIVINMAIHHLKEAKKINFSTHEDYEIVDPTTAMNTLEIDARSLLLASDLQRNDILQAIDQLPEHHKSVFNMYVIDQFTHNEIAKTLAISVGTSKSHLSRARKAIQAFLLEKIKGQPVDQKKKRRIVLLLLLGFGNQMLARFYKNQFHDFEIKPQKPFEMVPRKTPIPAQFVGLAKVVPIAKIVGITAGILSITAIVFYTRTFDKKISTPIKQEQFNSAPKQNGTTNTLILNQKVPIKIKGTAQKTKKPSAEKASVSKSKLLKPVQKTVAATPTDTVKQQPQKVVVIKKQIVKKDTVYVTK